jgi:hypothetical protein
MVFFNAYIWMFFNKLPRSNSLSFLAFVKSLFKTLKSSFHPLVPSYRERQRMKI